MSKSFFPIWHFCTKFQIPTFILVRLRLPKSWYMKLTIQAFTFIRSLHLTDAFDISKHLMESSMPLKYNEILKGISIIELYFENIEIGSKSMEEHVQLKEKNLQADRNNNLKLNFKRIDQICLGHALSSKGLSPSSSKVEMIQEYTVPRNKDDLYHFLSMYKYHNKYIA